MASKHVLKSILVAAAFVAPQSQAGKVNVATPGSITSVAIVNLVEDGLNYSHRAVTVFGNQKRVLENDWSLSEKASQSLIDTLSEAGIAASVMDVPEADMETALGKKCWTTWTSTYKAACQPQLDSLLARLDVDALVVLKPFEVQDYYFDSPILVSGLGVHTSGVGDSIHASVIVSHLGYHVYGHQGPLDSAICFSGEIDRKRKISVDPKSVDISDLAFARAEIETLLVDNARRSMIAAGVLSGTAEKCPLIWGRR